MSNIKERIFGAVTIMSERDAKHLWDVIINNFVSWDDIPEEDPDETDLQMLKEIKSDPDCKIFVSADEAEHELGLR